MVEERVLKEGTDLKKLILFFKKRIGMVVIAGVAGALIGSGLYLLITALTAGKQEYKITYDFYIDFSDGTMEAHDYYNAYTWNEVLKKDFLLDETMKALEQVSNDKNQPENKSEDMSENTDQVTDVPTKEEVAASLEATCPTDVKYMTVAVTYTDPVWAQRIADACVISLKAFGEKMQEFDTIDLIDEDQVAAIPRSQFSMRAMMTGVITFVILYILYFLFTYACDDSVYLPGEFEDRYGIRVLGMICKSKEGQALDIDNKANMTNAKDKISTTNTKKTSFNQYLKNELMLNLDYTIKHEKPVYICAVTAVEKQREYNEAVCEEAIEACEQMNHKESAEEHTFSNYEFVKAIFPIQDKKELDEIRKGCGVILAVPCGKKNGKLIEKLIHDLTIQDCKILGAILTKADQGFLGQYYKTLRK